MIHTVSIQRGRQGTWDTLKLIYGMGQAGARLVYVDKFVTSVPINRWETILREHWIFQDEANETLRSVRSQVESLMLYSRMVGDCDDAAVVAAALAIAANMSVGIVAVRPPEAADFTHVFVEAAGYRIDPTAPLNADYRNWERLVYPQ